MSTLFLASIGRTVAGKTDLCEVAYGEPHFADFTIHHVVGAELHIRHRLPEPGELLIPVSAVVLERGESS